MLAASLRQYHNEALRLLGELQDAGVELTFAHIYREYNAMADSLANEVLDRNPGRIWERWLP